MLKNAQPSSFRGRTTKRYALWGAFCLCYAAGSQAGQVALAWDANTQATLGGYKLYYGPASGNYTANVDVGNKTTYTVPNLTDGSKYYFAVKAYDTAKTTESAYSNEVSTVVAAQAATFSASPASGTATAGQAVTFTDTSTGSVTSRAWNFGNGQTGTGQTASTNFSSAGTYTVTLTTTGANGTATATQSYVVKPSSTTAPVANFTASPASGTAPLPVTFTDTSTGSVASWSWSFGDGATSTAKSPAHTYATVGSYTVKLTVTGTGGTTSVKSSTVTVTPGTTTGGGSGGLVAAYGFEELTGATAVDSSGLGNDGAITQAGRTNNGRFGRALSFDGVNDWVTVKDAASLDFSKAMTLEAWVYPHVAMSAWSSILAKETSTGSAYSLIANAGTNQPDAGVLTGSWHELPGGTSLPANTWKHLAATYDGAMLRLYIDAIQVAQGAVTGPIQVSNGVLRIGGHSILGDFFNGRIDEVRLYNRALAQAEIASDRARPILNSLWSTKAVPAVKADSDTGSVEVGVKFKSDAAGAITGLRFYKDASNTGTHVGSLWDSSGKLLARATFSGESASGWQQVNFASPVKIAANTVYVASYHANNGHYAGDTSYFGANYDRAPLHALGGSGNPNGVYAYGATPAFPTESYMATNYWVDVVFKR